MRLHKFLARAGVASRRASERLIAEGRVSVDGLVVTRPGTTVDADRQVVLVDGEPVSIPPARWVALHKPPATMSTRDDPNGRPTVYELLDEDAQSLFHVGRLDFMSEGLLLFTNEGDVANGLLHPRAGIRRTYEVTLVGPVSPGLPQAIVDGVELDDGLAAATDATWIVPPGDPAPIVRMTLLEGRNREIRRMLVALEVRVRRLCRVSFGPVALGNLLAGRTRDLGTREVESLRAVAATGD